LSYLKILFVLSLFIFGCGFSKYNSIVRPMVSHGVTIEADIGRWQPIGAGVAFTKDHKKYILTARHVIEFAEGITLRACSIELATECTILDSNQFEGILAPKHSVDDWAAMPIQKFPKGTSGATIGPTPQVGDSIWVIGSPLGIPGEVTQGIISNKSPFGYSIDARALPGNSGGGCYNIDGQLIGILIGIANTNVGVIETAGLVIPVPLRYL
jgi:serine protease Do